MVLKYPLVAKVEYWGSSKGLNHVPYLPSSSLTQYFFIFMRLKVRDSPANYEEAQ
jgi:hypothetical protein